jgi:cytochrome c biogenesis protein CcmG/thiol:disulfide interchange protein DsbE
MGSFKERNVRKMKILSKQRKASRVISSTGLLALFWLLAGLAIEPRVSWSQNFPQVGQKPAPAVGVPANDFALKTLDGRSIGLDTLRGKPLMMNFFASWCDPCRDEMPLVNALAAKGGKDGYHVLGIAVEDTRAAVTRYAEEASLVFPIALDLNSTVKRAYRIFGPPATFFIDAQGVIRDLVIGPITPERAREGLKKAGVIL